MHLLNRCKDSSFCAFDDIRSLSGQDLTMIVEGRSRTAEQEKPRKKTVPKISVRRRTVSPCLIPGGLGVLGEISDTQYSNFKLHRSFKALIRSHLTLVLVPESTTAPHHDCRFIFSEETRSHCQMESGRSSKVGDFTPTHWQVAKEGIV